MAVADLSPALGGEEFDTGPVHGADVLERCGSRKLARPDGLLQGRSGNEVEAVEIDAVGRDIRGDAQILAPDPVALAGKPVKEVDNHGRAIAIADGADEANRLLLACAPPLPPPDGGIEALHPDGDTIDSGLEAGVDLLGIEMDDAPLERDLAIGGEGE